VIEIKSEYGVGPKGYSENPFEEGGAPSRLNTFRNYREYIEYLLWEGSNVFQDGIDGGLDLWAGALEAEELFFNPIYKDGDLPRGDGSCVLIIPGFGGGDLSYKLPKDNLRELGWDAEVYPVKFGTHIEPTEDMIDPLIVYAKKKFKSSGRKIHIIGHSKGGHVVLAAAILRTEELAESADQLVIADAPIPDKVNFQIGVGYLAMQAIFGGNDFSLTELANDQEGLERIEQHFRLTTMRVIRRKIINGLDVGSDANIFEADCSHTGILNKPVILRFVHTRLARPLGPSQEMSTVQTFQQKAA